MNPYKIAVAIRKASKEINDTIYYQFDKIDGDARLSFHKATIMLELLASQIEDEADSEFLGEKKQ